MAFTLPELPYSYDALSPYMSKETLEFHHDKHHQAYVTNGNKLLEGTEFEGKTVEEVVKGSFGKNQALFNNAGQHYNHIHFWQWMKPNGGGKPSGAVEKALVDSFGSLEADELAGCSLARESSLDQNAGAICEGVRLLEIVGDQQHRHACRPDRAYRGSDRPARFEVDAGHGLVEDQELRLFDEGGRDVHPLAIAAGESPHRRMGFACALGEVERPGRPLTGYG